MPIDRESSICDQISRYQVSLLLNADQLLIGTIDFRTPSSGIHHFGQTTKHSMLKQG